MYFTWVTTSDSTMYNNVKFWQLEMSVDSNEELEWDLLKLLVT